MENVVKYQPSPKDYLEVASIIQDFLDGTGDRWAWDDFISISRRQFRDEYLSNVRFQCDMMPLWHPSTKLGQYCSDDGLWLLQRIVDDLRNRAIQLNEPADRGISSAS
jgi:hypothetical protein